MSKTVDISTKVKGSTVATASKVGTKVKGFAEAAKTKVFPVPS